MDKKLEARITRLEKMIKNEDVENDGAAITKYSDLAKKLWVYDIISTANNTEHEDGGSNTGDMMILASKLAYSQDKSAINLAKEIRTLVKKVESFIDDANNQKEELDNKLKELADENNWTKKYARDLINNAEREMCWIANKK